MLSDYKSKYSVEKITSNDKIEHFLYVQNFLQEFEEKTKYFTERYFTEHHFSDTQKKEALQYIEKSVEELASSI